MNRNTVTLSRLEQQLQEREVSFRDAVIPASTIRMEPERGDLVIHGESHPLQDHVISLLGPKLNAPASYLRRCPPALRAENVNHWMDRLGEKNLLVRFDGTEVRAVLSTRYTPVGNLDLVRLLMGFLPSMEAEAVVDLSETKMVAQVILPEYRRLMNVGDEVMGGIHLVNSEVGFSSVEVALYARRLVCSNGMIVHSKGASFKRIHLKKNGSLQEEVHGAFARIVEGIPKSLESFRGAMEVTLENPDYTLEQLPRRYGLSEAEHGAVEAAWQEEGGDTLFHLVNSITAGARDEELTVESHLKLQTLAGDLLPV